MTRDVLTWSAERGPAGHWIEDELPPMVLLDERTPAFWDGVPLHWHGWVEPVSVFLCANNGLSKPVLCPGCRHRWLPFHNRALSSDLRLTVDLERCGFCGLTLATSMYEGREPCDWVLDETDYGPDDSIV